jgi:glycerophosphoryl diester phosphodiesterase
VRTLFSPVSDGHVAGPAVVGHRGAPRVARENTPAAFAAAVAAGAGWVELDVRRSADDVLVVHHDPATAEGVVLVTRPAATLTELGVATLEHVLLTLPPGIGVDLEVKNLPGQPDYDDDNGVAGLLAALLDRLPAASGRGRPLLTSSFNPLTVQALAETLPEVPTGLLHAATLDVAAAAELAAEFGAGVLCSHEDADGLDAATLAEVHAAGYAVLVWTVDDPQRARGLAAAGVDAICTNDPAGTIAALSQP